MRSKNSILLLCGKLVSVFGGRIFSFAMSYYILKTTGSALGYAISLVLNYVPLIIFSPLGGILSDRVSIKRIIVSCDFMNGFIILLLSISAPGIGKFYFALFLIACISSVFSIAIDTGIPTIEEFKEPASLHKINSLMQSVSSLTNIVAPALGGVVAAAVDIKIIFIFSAVCFILSAISELFIEFGNAHSNKGLNKVDASKGMKETIAYIKSIPILNVAFVSECVLNFFYSFGVTSTMSYVVLIYLNLEAWHMGIVSSALSLGSVLAAFYLVKKESAQEKNMLYPFSKVMITAVNMFLYGLILLLWHLGIIGKSFSFVVMAVLSLFNGIAGVLINVPVSTAIQLNSTDAYRGKVIGTIRSFSYALIPIAVLLSGFIMDRTEAFLIPLITGALFIVTIILLIKWQTHLNKEVQF